MKKFELTTDSIKRNGVTLYRIKSLIDFEDVKAGDLGGYVEKEENLSQYGDAWAFDDAQVYGNALVRGNSRVHGDALVCDNARVFGNARVFDNACVRGDAQVGGNAWLSGDALVCDNARVVGNARLSGDADYIHLKEFGSHNRNTTMFREENGNIYVSCGYFSGTLEEFESKVKETHGSNKFAREYLALVEAAKIHFEV